MKKALILFSNEENREILEKSCLYLKEKLNYSLTGLIIRDIRVTNIAMGQNFGNYDIPNSLFIGEMIKLEQNSFEHLKESIKEDKMNIDMMYEVGITEETIREYMKEFDLLVIGKEKIFSDTMTEILKENYKSLLIIGEKELDFSNLYIGNDDGIKVNKSCYNFLSNFPDSKEFISLEIASTEKNSLVNYLESKEKSVKREILKNKEELVEYVEKLDKEGIFIMGNLSKSYFLERISRKTGLKLLEKCKLPIFIG